MKNLINELSRMEFVDEVISMEEGYMLVYKSLKYLLNTGRYSFLTSNFDFEDILDDVFATCIKRDLFNRFELSEGFKNGEVSNNGKKAYVKTAVTRMLLDMTNYRRTKMNISADATVDNEEENANLYNTLKDEKVNISEEVIAKIEVEKVLNALDGSKGNAEGYSPLLGFSKLNDKNVMLHVLNGYTVTEISNIYKNPKTGKPVAKTYISRVIKDCRKYF